MFEVAIRYRIRRRGEIDEADGGWTDSFPVEEKSLKKAVEGIKKRIEEAFPEAFPKKSRRYVYVCEHGSYADSFVAETFLSKKDALEYHPDLVDARGGLLSNNLDGDDAITVRRFVVSAPTPEGRGGGE